MIYVDVIWKKMIIIWVLIVLALSSCQEKTNSDKNEVDLSSTIGREWINFFDNLNYDLKFTTIDEDPIIIGPNSHIKLVNSTGIYIENASTLYRYSTEGEVRNKIGAKGQGPGEYPYPGTVGFINPAMIVLNNSGRMQYFDTLGTLVGEIPLSNGLEGASVLNDSTLIAYSREFDAEHFVETLHWLTLTGIEKASREIYSDTESVDMVAMGWPTLDQMNDRLIFRDEWSTDIYSIGENGIYHMVNLDFGQRNPSRGYYQDGNLMERAPSEIIYIQKLISNGHLAFLTLLYEQKLQQIIIDISSREVLYSKIYVEQPDTPLGMGMRNIPTLKFWPEYISPEGDFYAIAETSHLSEDAISALRKISGCKLVDEDSHLIICLKNGAFSAQ